MQELFVITCLSTKTNEFAPKKKFISQNSKTKYLLKIKQLVNGINVIELYRSCWSTRERTNKYISKYI